MLSVFNHSFDISIFQHNQKKDIVSSNLEHRGCELRQTTCPGFSDRDVFAEVIQGKCRSLPYSVLREIAVFCMHEVERVMKFGAALSAVEWKPNNRPEIASGSEDGHMRIVDAGSGSVGRTSPKWGTNVSAVAWSPGF